jgi:hypothetical protein
LCFLDPFADTGTEKDVQDGKILLDYEILCFTVIVCFIIIAGLVHIRIQQRNGRKTLTTVQGLSSNYDLKKIVRSCKKEFACNGTVVDHHEYGEVLQLQGTLKNLRF